MKIMNLAFATPLEIAEMLGGRLRAHRIAKNLKQADLAKKAGVSTATVSNIETGCNVGISQVIALVVALGLERELSTLFVPKLETLEDLKRYERQTKRVRSANT